MHMYAYTCNYIHLQFIHTYIYVHMYRHIHIYMYLHVCVYIHTYICTYMYMYIHMHFKHISKCIFVFHVRM